MDKRWSQQECSVKVPPCEFIKNIGKIKMLSMEYRSRLKPEEVITRLKEYFGRDLGLALAEEKPGCLTFEGGGGFVTATLCEENKKTKIEIVTREWGPQVQAFISRL
jgi:hypothetical protein